MSGSFSVLKNWKMTVTPKISVNDGNLVVHGKTILTGVPDNVVAGSGIGGLLSAVHSFNTGIPYLQNRLKGPKWLPFVVGLPPLLIFSGASAAFGGYALPKFTQLTVTSYYAASSASHYGISLITRHIEDSYSPQTQQERHR